MELSSILSQANLDKLIAFAPKIVAAILILIIGMWIANKLSDLLKKLILNNGLDETLAKFLSDIASAFLKIMVLFSAAGQIGIQTTSFVAIFGALMVGIGMALNGTIGHIASGIMLMIFRPFKVGDLVKVAGGETGTVDAINAFNTTLLTLDNRKVIIANSKVTDNIITNISGQGVAGVELSYKVPYSVNIDEARAIILKVGKECPTVVNEPAQGVVVGSIADGGVTLNTRPFCKSEDYWDTKFYMEENIKKAFDAAGIGIAAPKMLIEQIS